MQDIPNIKVRTQDGRFKELFIDDMEIKTILNYKIEQINTEVATVTLTFVATINEEDQ